MNITIYFNDGSFLTFYNSTLKMHEDAERNYRDADYMIKEVLGDDSDSDVYVFHGELSENDESSTICIPKSKLLYISCDDSEPYPTSGPVSISDLEESLHVNYDNWFLCKKYNRCWTWRKNNDNYLFF